MAGLSMYHNGKTLGMNCAFDDDVDATASDNIDQGPTNLKAIFLTNEDASIVYLKLWNDKDPVVGTDGPWCQFPIAASEDACVVCPNGVAFSEGLSFASTTDAGTSGTTDPTTPYNVYITTDGGA